MTARHLLVLALTFALAGGLGAAAVAIGDAGGSADGTIHACAQKDTGRLRAVDAAEICGEAERALAWSIRGPKGDPGPPGPGIQSIEQLSGLQCGADGEGKTAVEISENGSIALRCVSPAPALRINEFMTGTATSASDEFVEILNAGDAAADVGGYRLVYRSATGTSDVTLAVFPSGTTIPAGGRYLFGGNGYAGSALLDQSFSAGLASTGGGIGLRDAQSALVDSVGYGTSVSNGFTEGSPAPAPPQVDPPGASASRLPDGTDTNDNASDFSSTSPPTPGASNR